MGTETMDCIRQNRSMFKSVAEQMGIAPEALAGAMAGFPGVDRNF
jgi:hypothetical protein